MVDSSWCQRARYEIDIRVALRKSNARSKKNVPNEIPGQEAIGPLKF